MPNPFKELAEAAITVLGTLDPAIPAVRTRSHRFTPEAFATTFGDKPAVIMSEGSVARTISDQCRDSRRATVTLVVTVLDVEERCDPTATATQDVFDDYVDSVEKALATFLPTTTFGTAKFLNSNETDDIDATRGLGDYESTIELTYFIESTEV